MTDERPRTLSGAWKLRVAANRFAIAREFELPGDDAILRKDGRRLVTQQAMV